MILWILGGVVYVTLLAIPWWALAIASRQRRELRRLEERLASLERKISDGPVLTAVPAPAEAHPAPAPPEPIPFPHVHAPAPPPVPPAHPLTTDPAPAAPPDLVAPETPAEIPPPRARRPGVEEMVGGVWLQNVGAVLLLLSVFFLIVWGFTTGRIGPGGLVIAGVALGLTFVARGHSVTRRIRLFGHGLIGIGVGIVYVSLYLGHFTLHVLGTGVAFVALALVSIGAVALGLGLRAQTVAALGVIGAFLPQLIAAWIPLRGFSLPAAHLLGYFAIVNLLVFVLASRAGWNGLDLAALFLTSLTWIATIGHVPWGWPVEAGLAGLFVLLGLAPLPRLVREGGPVAPLALAVVALAPLCLVATSWPFFAYATRPSVVALLAGLAILYLGAALWVDARRPERDLWRPLTGAATLFLTAALQRAVGSEHTPMAWCVEGAILVALGSSDRGGWLRALGYAVEASGVLWLFSAWAYRDPWILTQPPVFHPASVRDLTCAAALVFIAALPSRRRDALGGGDAMIRDAATLVANVLLASWSLREAQHVARSLIESGGRWTPLPYVGAPLEHFRVNTLANTLAAFLWLVQSLALLRLGMGERGGLLRCCAYFLAGGAALTLLLGAIGVDAWQAHQAPVLHPASLITLACVVTMALGAHRLAMRRDRLTPQEHRAPEIATVAANLILLAWSAREAHHVFRFWGGGAGGGASAGTFASALTSGAWTLQAAALLTLGWIRNAQFLRWLGLGLFGVTVLKFLLLDLQQVDLFWRFLTAMLVGAALLAVSYAYQRRTKERSAAGE